MKLLQKVTKVFTRIKEHIKRKKKGPDWPEPRPVTSALRRKHIPHQDPGYNPPGQAPPAPRRPRSKGMCGKWGHELVQVPGLQDSVNPSGTLRMVQLKCTRYRCNHTRWRRRVKP